jgi:hypothetical protein
VWPYLNGAYSEVLHTKVGCRLWEHGLIARGYKTISLLGLGRFTTKSLREREREVGFSDFRAGRAAFSCGDYSRHSEGWN